MNMLRHAERREKLRRLMHDQELAGLLVTLDANRYYLSGFELIDHQVNESAGCLLITNDGKDWLCTDARYADAARRIWEPGRVFIYGADSAASIRTLAKNAVSGNIGFEESAMSVRFFNTFSEGLTLKPADGIVEKLRIRKEPEEIQRMEAAAGLNHKLMERISSELLVGRTEKDIAWTVERFFRENGAEALSFPCITAVGPNAALPHAVPGETRITENTCVLVDVGCRLNDYCSDQTRTFWVGDKPADIFLDTIALVQEAQQTAINVIRPGMAVSDIYAAAKNFLDDNKVGDRFTHGLGHGIGLQTHEAPSLNARGTTILEPGMIVTVEPGLYYPDWGGVRWEYMVLVTEDACRVL